MDVRIIDTYNIDEYNKKATHPLQSWQWGEARKKMGLKVIRVGEFENDTLINVFQFTIHPLPHIPFSIAYLPRSVFPSKEVLEFLYTYCKENKIIFLKFEPNIKKITNYELQIINFVKKSPHPLFPSWTQVLDLNSTEDELLAKMKSKTRYNVRLAQKKGVVVTEESNEKGFEKFIKLYFDTCKRQHYFGHTPKYHKIVFETLKDSISHILIASYEDEPLATYELFYFNNVFYYPYGGTSDLHRNLMAANLIMWEAARLGKSLGAQSFEMWGSLPPNYDQNHPWAGFTRFKEGYGTEFVEMIGSYDLIVNPAMYKVYNVSHKVRDLLLKFKR